jgi:methylmalonyl-CoA mutase N-terminal domain/subunit
MVRPLGLPFDPIERAAQTWEQHFGPAASMRAATSVFRVQLTGAGNAADALEILRVSHQVDADQRAERAARRQGRDDGAARAAVARMVEVARTEENLVPAMLDAARAEATVGEICDALRAEWGTYTEPARF